MADDAGVGKWTSKILEYGFCFVDGCPVSPEKTEELLERIAFIRFTHYGGFYDFTSDLTMKDTAYTSLALPAHTDTTYFTDPAGLQMFHLLSHTAGEGGQSLLVDGFKCANTLKGLHPEAYELLKTVPVQWHASGNEGIVITPTRKFPVFNHNIEKSAQPGYDLGQIRWNNDDRAALPLWNYQDTNHGIQKWYEAAALWNNIVKSAENEYWEQLVPGRPLIFDNWRVMHGRSAFTGKRRICGGYINRDDFISKYMNTNFSRQEILDRIL
ncbi:MAG: hypothetical protein M1818_000384 [Claussenomyces sp. TS43310]|nr:MAG: hypothetical protein M1818_000384 [Claussenomyces sp. TS43310]